MSRCLRSRTLAFGAALVLGPGVAVAEPPGDVLRVKRATGDTIVQVIATPFGGLVRADVLARLLGGHHPLGKQRADDLVGVDLILWATQSLDIELSTFVLHVVRISGALWSLTRFWTSVL